MPGSVAIIIPVYNVTEFLEDALKSATQQKYKAKEIIVVDDGSDKKAAQHIASLCSKFPEIILICQPHAGTAVARETGLKRCTSDYIYFFDGDDKMHPNALQYLTKKLDKNPLAIACYACYRFMDAESKITSRIKPARSRRVSRKEVLHKLLEIRLPFITGTILIRRHALETITANNQHLKYGEDWALWCQLALAGDIFYAGRKVVHYCRKHAKNTTAGFTQNPEPIFTTYESIYKNPSIQQAVGKDELARLEKIAIGHAHMKLAAYYAAHGETEKAQHHLERMNLLPHALKERLKKE